MTVRKVSTLIIVLVLFFLGQNLIGGDVPNSAENVQPLLPGMTAPGVNFTSLDGSKFELLKEAAEKPIILIFYRGGW